MDEEFYAYEDYTLRYEEMYKEQKKFRTITRLQEIEQAAKSTSNLLPPGTHAMLFTMIGQLTQIIREELVE